MSKRFSALIVLFTLSMGSALAGDGWQGRPSACGNIPPGLRADRCHQWVQTVKRPDYLDANGNPIQSCCGEADLWIADNFEVVDGKLYMIITADYPEVAPTTFDEEGNAIPGTPTTFHATRGDRILIPPEKMITRAEDANRSPHGVIFMRPATGEVLCATLPPLI